MEKRYQVFISSTYQDLQGARQEVSQALLRADCFPAGMELFPAADEEQFEFIKTVIDQSDYYIIISAGRYGSIHPETGLSYTEMEYDYAVEIGKPVIRLLHKDPFTLLPGGSIEATDIGRESLHSFREKMKNGKLVSFWLDPKELGQLVLLGLMDAKRRFPTTGWVRSGKYNPVEAENIVLKLERRVGELQAELETEKSRAGVTPKVEESPSRHLSLRSFSESVFDGVDLESYVYRTLVELSRLKKYDDDGDHIYHDIGILRRTLRSEGLSEDEALIALSSWDRTFFVQWIGGGEYFWVSPDSIKMALAKYRVESGMKT